MLVAGFTLIFREAGASAFFTKSVDESLGRGWVAGSKECAIDAMGVD